MGYCIKPVRKGRPFPDCGKPTEGGERLCQKHLQEARELVESDWEKNTTEGEGNCITYTGTITEGGYGMAQTRGINGPVRSGAQGSVTAHRMALYLDGRLQLPLHEFAQVDHSCKNRNCVNPEHLYELSEIHLHRLLDAFGKHEHLDAHVLQHIRTAYPEGGKHIDKLLELVRIKHGRDADSDPFSSAIGNQSVQSPDVHA